MKILLILTITLVCSFAQADTTFRVNIPQPDRITNGDFDGDGILDQDDDTPFGGNGNGGVVDDVVSSFVQGQVVTLSTNDASSNNIENLTTTVLDVSYPVDCLFNGMISTTSIVDSNFQIAELSGNAPVIVPGVITGCWQERWDFNWNLDNATRELVLNLIEPASVSTIYGDNTGEYYHNVPDAISLHYSIDSGATWIELGSWPNFYPDVNFSGLQTYSFTPSPVTDMFKIIFNNNSGPKLYWPEMHLLSN